MSTEPRRLGKYELYAQLGHGGMGDVWKAFDPQLRRFVAIKLLLPNLQADPGFVARFKREAQLIASLHHPNIVQIYDFQFDDASSPEHPTAYMVMDFIEGQTLADYIHHTSHQGQIPSATDIVILFTSVSLAIDYAHQQGVVHRDIKPANILLDKRSSNPGKRNTMGEPILTDFGIARLQGPSTLVSSRLGLGTPLYISPEQAQGQGGNQRSDLYSLGVIVYEMLTGITPFRADNPFSILLQHYTDPPPPPESINPNITPAVSAVILRSLAKDPNARFPSASAMTIALAEALYVPVPAELNQHVTSTNATESHSSSEASSLALSAPPSPGDQTTPMDMIGSNEVPMAYAESRGSSSAEWVSAKVSDHGQPNPTTMHEPLAASPPTSSPSLPVAVTPQLLPRAERRKPLMDALIVLIAILVVSSVLGTILLLAQKGGHPPIISSPVVGHVFFASSGQTSQNSSQGIADQLTIDLSHIPAPSAGKSYYAWLVGDSVDSEAQAMLLGNLSVDHGRIHFSFDGDQQHDDLIANNSRFLITVESSSVTPIVPTTDLSARVYYAAFPEIPAASDHYSLLDHLRHLLAEDPKLRSQGLHGGLDAWLLKNTQQIAQWASDAKQTHSTSMRRQDLVDMLYYLDGVACVQADLQGVTQGTPATPENATVAKVAHVALLETCGQLPIPGYLVHIGTHLNGVIHAPGAMVAQQKLANQITQELDDLNMLLVKVRQDAQQLVKMSDAQLLQPAGQALLNDLAIQASHAYSASSSAQPGALQLHDDIERLATMDVMACPTGGTANVCS